MGRTAVTIGFSVPPELAADIERIAAAEGRSKSELFRDMCARYKRERELEAFEELAEHGRQKAKRRGISSEADVERLIHEARGGA